MFSKDTSATPPPTRQYDLCDSYPIFNASLVILLVVPIHCASNIYLCLINFKGFR